MMTNSDIEIYQSKDGQTQIEVKFENETVWLNRHQLAFLFDRDIKTIGKHITNVFKEGELEKEGTVANFAIVQNEGGREVERKIEHYNLDVIISVGYRVKSQRGTQFRQWATQRIKDYLIQGYAVNEKRLAQKQQEVRQLKTGIQILNRAIEEKSSEEGDEWLRYFSKGLELLDDYDHERLDHKGLSIKKANFPEAFEYMNLIEVMKKSFDSAVFGKEKDSGFQSSITQITKGFGNQDFYPSLEEKAAALLYLIIKNHSFVDGNKRIAAACFLLFLERNNMLMVEAQILISKHPNIGTPTDDPKVRH
jgi:prophage maintenance system killer protein